MGKRSDNIILVKTMEFAVRIVNLYRFLSDGKKENILSKQLLRCGTSIGANMREADEAISSADFISKTYISLKEARETEFWLELLYRTQFLSDKEFNSINKDLDEILRMLVTIIKTKKAAN